MSTTNIWCLEVNKRKENNKKALKRRECVAH